MSNSSRKPLPISDPNVVRNLSARAQELRAERSLNQIKRVELDVRDRQIDRDCLTAKPPPGSLASTLTSFRKKLTSKKSRTDSKLY